MSESSDQRPPDRGTADASGPDLGALGRGGLLNLVGSVFSGVIGFGLVIVITRGLGAESGGALLEAIALFSILYYSASLGTEQSLVRFISQARATGDLHRIEHVISAALVPVAAAGVACAAALYAAAPALAEVLGHESDIAALESSFRAVAWFTPLAALMVATLAATRGFATFKPTVTIDRIGRPAAQLGFLLATAGLGAGVIWSAVAWSAPFALALVPAALALMTLLRRQRGNAAGSAPERHREPGLTARFWRFSVPSAIAVVLQVSTRWLDTLLVGALMGPAQAAVYTAATRLVTVGGFVNQAILQTTAPQIAAALAVDDRAGARTIYATSTTWLVIAVWPLYLVTAGYGAVVLEMFGPGFSAGATALAILSAALIVASACGPVEIVLLMSGRSGRNLANNALGLASNIVLNLLLIPRLGLTGAAIAWFVALSITNVIPLVQVWLHLGLHPFGPTFRLGSLTALTCFGIPAALANAFTDPNVPIVLTSIAVSTVAYSSLLFLLRRRLDLHHLISAVRGARSGAARGTQISQ